MVDKYNIYFKKKTIKAYMVDKYKICLKKQ